MTLDQIAEKAFVEGCSAFQLHVLGDDQPVNPYTHNRYNLEERVSCRSWRLGYFEALCSDAVALFCNGILDENGELK